MQQEVALRVSLKCLETVFRFRFLTGRSPLTRATSCELFSQLIDAAQDMQLPRQECLGHLLARLFVDLHECQRGFGFGVDDPERHAAFKDVGQ